MYIWITVQFTCLFLSQLHLIFTPPIHRVVIKSVTFICSRSCSTLIGCHLTWSSFIHLQLPSSSVQSQPKHIYVITSTTTNTNIAPSPTRCVCVWITTTYIEYSTFSCAVCVCGLPRLTYNIAPTSPARCVCVWITTTPLDKTLTTWLPAFLWSLIYI